MQPLTSLIIDDSRVMRSMVMQNLKKSRLSRLVEFNFIEAEDGAAALAKFDAEDVDIAFVDWNMPNMTGIEFVRQVRARGNTEHIPLVMVTSEKSMGKIEEALDEAGATAYICKPFTPQELESKLEKLFEALVTSKQQPEAGGFFSKLFG